MASLLSLSSDMETSETSQTSQTVDSVIAALTGLTDALPRRAVLTSGGGIGDKRTHGGTEIPALSVACELLRRHKREPVHPRDTVSLMRACLESNSRGAWEALLDDVKTHDFDTSEASSVLNSSEHTIVMCIVGATPGQHCWSVIRASLHCFPLLSVATTRRTASAFIRLFGDVATAVGRWGRDVTADDRASCITVMGKLMVYSDVSVGTLVDLLEMSLATKTDDVLRLFIFTPIEQMVRLKPGIVDGLVRRFVRASQASKYPSCAMLALVPADAVKPHAEKLLKTIHSVLATASAQQNMDLKLALACSMVLRSISEPRSLQASMAHSLVCMATKCSSNMNIL